MHHPWRALRDLPHWNVVFTAALPIGILGLTCWDTNTIRIAHGLSQRQRRAVVEHERQHAIRGPVADHPVLTAKEERAVDVAAARNLIGLRDLGEALAWAHTLDEAAEELWVDRHTLDVRLAHLHPAERHYLRRRLADEH